MKTAKIESTIDWLANKITSFVDVKLTENRVVLLDFLIDFTIFQIYFSSM